jgi:ABC-type branched-subunit amino acid transport system ATPase component/branched-subunit amino acid ABC-type transport system permease component
MSEVIQFALLGLGLGALYSLAAQGLMIVYRGSGVLNFAHGAVGMVAAYLCWDLSVRNGVPWWLAFIIGVAVSAAIGALSNLLIMRPLRKASSLSRIAATLGILIICQGIIVFIYGADIRMVASQLPTDRINITSNIGVTVDRLILFAVAAGVSALLWYVYKHTKFGLGTAAVAENERVAASLGWSPDKIATANWTIGTGLAGAASILIAPIVQLQPITMTNLVIAALAPALIAGFKSFPIVFVAGIGVGVLQTEVQRFVEVPGLGQSIPFIIIILFMVFKGASLPARDFFLQRQPQLGSGRVRPWVLIPLVLIGAVFIMLLPPVWQDSFTIFFGMALVLLSVVVLTGYTGQISLAQYAVAGLGAWIVARLDVSFGLPFFLALVIGVIVIAPLGALFALPAARTRGLSLAVATMGIGTALEFMVFNNASLTGGAMGLDVTPPSLFGFSLDAILEPGRYAVFAMVAFVIVALGVANIRRGRSGRRMIAVRTNERAAAALGISVSQTKVFAFAVAAAVAALGGIVLAYRNDVVLFSEFTNLMSVNLVAWIMVGGVGFILGPIWGAQLAPSSVGTQIATTLFPQGHEIVAIVGGVLVILFLLQGEGGLTKANMDFGQLIARLFGWKPKPPASSVERGVLPEEVVGFTPVEAATLEVQNVTVRYGAVVAVEDLSLTLRAHTIVGLIGPNGAGKTTAIDAITGFVKPTSGQLFLDGRDVTSLTAAGRAQAGITRSFQSLELFEDMSVLDNLRTAGDSRDVKSFARDIVWPQNEDLSPSAVAAIRQFDLVGDLDTPVSDLSLGKRRLVAIARSVAAQPRVLLLDEPAAGLGDRESLELAGMVRRLADELGLAILLVEHDMNFVMSVCDEICVLDFGKTICAGTPEKVRSDPATIRAYLGGEDPDHIESRVGLLSNDA